MNLPDLIKTGESDTVEFKEKFDERTIESSVAFANTKGGVIFIGVSDKNNVKGIKIGKETLNQWTAYSLKGPQWGHKGAKRNRNTLLRHR